MKSDYKIFLVLKEVLFYNVFQLPTSTPPIKIILTRWKALIYEYKAC